MQRIQTIVARNFDLDDAQTLVAKCMRVAKRAETYKQTYSEVLDEIAEQQADAGQRFAAAKLLAPLASRLEHDFREIAPELLWYLNHGQHTNQFGNIAASISKKLAKEHPKGAKLADLIRSSRKQIDEYFKDDVTWLESLEMMAEESAIQLRAKEDDVIVTTKLEDGKQVQRVWHSQQQSGQLVPVSVESLYGDAEELLFACVLAESEMATDRPIDVYAETVAAMALTRDRLYQHVRELEDGNLGVFRGSVIPALIIIGIIALIAGAVSFAVGIILNFVGGCSSTAPPSTICDVAQAFFIAGIALAVVGAGLFFGGGGAGTINGFAVNAARPGG